MSMTLLAEGVFQALRIHYKKIRFPDSELFLCTSRDGLTFNMELHPGQNVELWRFLRSNVPAGRTGSRIEYQTADHTLGLEITEERDLSFFSRQCLADDRPDCMITALRDQISEFLRLNDGIQKRYAPAMRA